MKDRISITSPSFAKTLFGILEPHLPEFPYHASSLKSRKSSILVRRAHSLNSNIRLYKYTPGQRFGVHYDDSVKDVMTGAKSEWTLLVYLSGVEDGVVGGEVRSLFLRVRVLGFMDCLIGVVIRDG